MNRGIVSALVAAALFGASTPLAKALLGAIDPVVLAGLLYAGAGWGIAVLLALRLAIAGSQATLAWPARREWAWLAAAILFGGVLAPVLLMLGLALLSASTASLLLNLEVAFTVLLAWVLFRENLGRRSAFGIAAIVGAGFLLSIRAEELTGSSGGVALVAAACLCWAIDNNLTRKVSSSDAFVVAGVKGVVAGAVNLALAAALGLAMPDGFSTARAATVGFLSYGVSVALFVVALRNLGTARASAYFAVAPFFGAALGVVFSGDGLTWQLLAAAALMAVGVALSLSESHDHEHLHDALDHVHAHVHDAHHRHAHDFAWDGAEPHVHRHRHTPVVHRHPHLPDVHHRHPH